MIIKANGEITSESEINKEEEVEEEPEDEAMEGDMLMVRSDIAPYRACRPWIFFINGVLCFLDINGNGTKKEESVGPCGLNNLRRGESIFH